MLRPDDELEVDLASQSEGTSVKVPMARMIIALQHEIMNFQRSANRGFTYCFPRLFVTPNVVRAAFNDFS